MAGGAVLGWTSNISEDMKALTYNGIEINDDNLGWIGSLVTLGAVVICFPIGKFCDMLGRKNCMLLLTAPFMLGWALIIFANSLTMLYVGRFLTGMSGGAFCVSAPIYTSEIAEKEIRGALGSYFELMLTVGILISYAVPLLCDIKTFTVLMSVLPLVFLGVFFFQPESPVYLIKNHRQVEARASLIRLRGRAYDVESEMFEIKQTLEAEKNQKTSTYEVLRKRGTQKALLISFGLMFFQQAGGVNAIVFYTGSIFQSAGSSLDSKVSTIIIGVMQVVATFISSIMVDKLGRRFLLISSSLIVAISSVFLGVFFSLQERKLVSEETLSKLGYIPVVAISVYVIMFSMGLGPVPWVISAEVLPPEIKSSGIGIASTINWFSAFITTKFYLNLQAAIGGDMTFYLFAALSVIGTIFIHKLLLETKGKTLDEIQQELNNEIKSPPQYIN